MTIVALSSRTRSCQGVRRACAAIRDDPADPGVILTTRALHAEVGQEVLHHVGRNHAPRRFGVMREVPEARQNLLQRAPHSWRGWPRVHSSRELFLTFPERYSLGIDIAVGDRVEEDARLGAWLSSLSTP